MTEDDFFAGYDHSRALFGRVRTAMESVGAAQVRFTRSQAAFRRRRAFAWAWIPGRYLRGEQAPLVLGISLHDCDPSPRWKQVVEPAPGRRMHHLELRRADDIDADVVEWLRRAWEAAG